MVCGAHIIAILFPIAAHQQELRLPAPVHHRHTISSPTHRLRNPLLLQVTPASHLQRFSPDPSLYPNQRTNKGAFWEGARACSFESKPCLRRRSRLQRQHHNLPPRASAIPGPRSSLSRRSSLNVSPIPRLLQSVLPTSSPCISFRLRLPVRALRRASTAGSGPARTASPAGQPSKKLPGVPPWIALPSPSQAASYSSRSILRAACAL
ncbi:hypothetical protein B0T14DRAFT_238607 [Immersiella caudata]|uniref:Uncharacterized protein n=1 Tax=Immersiella caudata TaxID=314043 RepID=A0AA39WT89_9PEZI|nr:hypothetical protein B0T14DRAFT_238607 [Immersiella caudata]